jgi:sporulation protein YqfC
MGRKKKRLLQLFDLPSDVTADTTRLEWIKDGQLFIENHRGIQHFSASELRVNTASEQLKITGEQLSIKTINRYIMIITGKLDEIKYIK